MKKISTPYSTSIRMFPYLFYGFIAFIAFLLLINGALTKSPMLLAVLIVMPTIGYFYQKFALQDLVDEVFDGGEFLLVRKGREEEKIPLAKIINVSFVANVRPERITLRIAEPGKFGSEISFAPPPKIYFSSVPKNEIAEDLILRAARARKS